MAHTHSMPLVHSSDAASSMGMGTAPPSLLTPRRGGRLVTFYFGLAVNYTVASASDPIQLSRISRPLDLPFLLLSLPPSLRSYLYYRYKTTETRLGVLKESLPHSKQEDGLLVTPALVHQDRACCPPSSARSTHFLFTRPFGHAAISTNRSSFW